MAEFRRPMHTEANKATVACYEVGHASEEIIFGDITTGDVQLAAWSSEPGGRRGSTSDDAWLSGSVSII